MAQEPTAVAPAARYRQPSDPCFTSRTSVAAHQVGGVGEKMKHNARLMLNEMLASAQQRHTTHPTTPAPLQPHQLHTTPVLDPNAPFYDATHGMYHLFWQSGEGLADGGGPTIGQ